MPPEDHSNAVAPRTPAQVLRQQLGQMAGEFKAALPSHISPDKFQRVVMTVAQQNPDLLNADRQSLMASCLKCAADGLIPDGRDAALVLFSGKVQYMPMAWGLLKRLRNTGEIASVTSRIVRQKDKFTYVLGDEESLTHEPHLGEDAGPAIAAYAIAKLTNGEIIREVMTKAEIEKVRNSSRAKGAGPWTQWWDEMARKTVFRRLSKWLPSTPDLEKTMEAIDREMEVVGESASASAAAQSEAPRRSASDILSAAADPEPAPQPQTIIDGETGEVIERPKAKPAARAYDPEIDGDGPPDNA